MASFGSLPVEVVCEIIGLLTPSPPSLERSGFRPHPGITDQVERNLKNLSYTCRGLHRLVVKELFQHVRLKIHINDFKWLGLRERYLCSVDSISEVHREGDFRWWPEIYHQMLDFLIQTELALHVESVTIVIEASELDLKNLDPDITTSIEQLWPRYFPAILRLTVVAPFAVLNKLVGMSNAREMSSNLRPIYQSLTLSTTPQTEDSYQEACAQDPTRRKTAISWDEITLNEGSLRPDHHLASYPMLLANMSQPQLPMTVPSIIRRSIPFMGRCRTFTYITVFPSAAHLKKAMSVAVYHSHIVRLQLLPCVAECVGSEFEVGMTVGRVAHSIKNSFMTLLRHYIGGDPLGWDKRLLEFHMLDPYLLKAPFIWADIVEDARQLGWLNGWVQESGNSNGNVLVRNEAQSLSKT